MTSDRPSAARTATSRIRARAGRLLVIALAVPVPVAVAVAVAIPAATARTASTSSRPSATTAALGPLLIGPGTTAEVPLLPRHRAVAVSGPLSASANGIVAFTAESNRFAKYDRNKDLDAYVFNQRSRKLTMVSRARNRRPGKKGSGQPQISRSGREVVFSSGSPDLVRRDTNRTFDIFLRKLKSQRTRRISVTAAGKQANGPSLAPVMSADGAHVAFLSAASNLVPDDTNGRPDVFLLDLRSGAIERVDVASDGRQASQGAVNDTLPGAFTRSALSRTPGLAISADGGAVAFLSRSADLVEGDTNGVVDVFVRDLAQRTTERVSVASSGAQADADSQRPFLTADGRAVIFATSATNLVGEPTEEGTIVIRDRAATTTALAATNTAGEPLRAGGNEESTPLAISADGRFMVFVARVRAISTTDADGHQMVLADRSANTLELTGVDSRGRPGNNTVDAAAISDDGRRILFTSNSTNLIPQAGGRRHALFLRTRTG